MMIFPNTSDIWRQLENYGIRIILTHPERNLILQTNFEQIEKWVGEGFYMQVTAMSLLGMFGRKANKIATRMLDKGLVHFVASDGHDPHRASAAPGCCFRVGAGTLWHRAGGVAFHRKSACRRQRSLRRFLRA